MSPCDKTAIFLVVVLMILQVQVYGFETVDVNESSCNGKPLRTGWGNTECSSFTSTMFTKTCNIKKVNNISQVDFLHNFAYKEPVIITNITDNSLFKEVCEKDSLLENYGHKTVTLSTANTHSYDKVHMSFTEYVERILTPQDYNKSGQETLYFFGNHDYSEWEDLFKHYIIPPYELPLKSPALSFGIAGAGTGVPFHFHGPGFAEVIHGSKRWFLLPYERKPSFNPDKTTLRWLIEDYETVIANEDMYECILKPAEILYFPDKWWHATLNVEDSVFMSTFLG